MPVLKVRDENGKFVEIPAIKGQDGKSAYEIWLELGNEGTEEDFIASLKGEQGQQGEPRS